MSDPVRAFLRSSATGRLVVVVAGCVLLAACGTSGEGAKGPSFGTSAPVARSSTTTTTQLPQQPTVACTSLKPLTWSVPPAGADLATEVGAGRAPNPYNLAKLTGRPTTGVLYPTPEDFLAQASVDDPGALKAIMVSDGYRGGVEAEWGGARPFTIQVLNFASAPAAVDYFVARLPALCQGGGTQGGVTPLSKNGGMTWVDVSGATHGEFVLGSNQISLTLCACDREGRVERAQAWVAALEKKFASGPPEPVR